MGVRKVFVGWIRMMLQKILRPEVMEVQIQGAEVLVWVWEADALVREAALRWEEGPDVAWLRLVFRG